MREYTEYIKKEMMLKHRYNVNGYINDATDKLRQFNRANSFAEWWWNKPLSLYQPQSSYS